jgi:hypothetical protein
MLDAALNYNLEKIEVWNKGDSISAKSKFDRFACVPSEHQKKRHLKHEDY